MSHTTTSTAIASFLESVCGRHEPECWATGAVLDAVVPGWRFTTSGAAAVEAQFRGWYREPGVLEEVRRQATATGEVVELTVTWVENGVPHASRQVHVLELDDHGRIVHDDMWCGGRWPATLLAEMEAASDAG
ncbi:MAG TPA: hypothetical protein VGQ80_19585 [Acidimicrobiia bacterium]|nr:hypothetical protein [Acidimicrobiia bacterium]